MVSSQKSIKVRVRQEKYREINPERTSQSKKKTPLFKILKICWHTRYRNRNKGIKKVLSHELRKIHVQKVESKSDFNFPCQVEAQVS